MKIKEVKATIIKNSRNHNTIQVTINKKYHSSAPSGASTGSHEIPAYKRSLPFAIKYINSSKELKGLSFDEFNDLSYFNSWINTLGANPIVALQGAILKAMTDNQIYSYLNPRAKKLPTPLGNCIGGGAHVKKPSIDIQEFLLIPKVKGFKEKVILNDYIYKKLKKALNPKIITDEGGLVPNISDLETFEFLADFLNNPNNTLDHKVYFGIDLAATELYKKMYTYKNFSKTIKTNKLRPEDQIELINDLIYRYKLKYVEDPLEENDFEGFSKITKSTLVCGDDLITTNLERLKQAIQHNSVNSIIIKPNQIGSLTKTKEIVDYAKREGITTVISHRSGETLDPLISHLAVAWEIPYIKTGIYGKERKAKLKELELIENNL
ncbi:enolase [archaeon]|nr:enolase [archaeon]|tara:strand:- start:875 stop:2014 length:1140 start_codon:yes stop_codon:yes gene_type:complete